MQAITLAAPPQMRHVSTSISNTRLSLCAQVIAMDGMYAGFAGAKTGHRHMTLGGRFLVLILCDFLATLAPPRRGHQHPVFAIRGDKIAGSDFEQPKAGPMGGGQDARSNTPWNRVRLTLGLGTRTASFAMKSTGSKMT